MALTTRIAASGDENGVGGDIEACALKVKGPKKSGQANVSYEIRFSFPSVDADRFIRFNAKTHQCGRSLRFWLPAG